MDLMNPAQRNFTSLLTRPLPGEAGRLAAQVTWALGELRMIYLASRGRTNLSAEQIEDKVEHVRAAVADVRDALLGTDPLTLGSLARKAVRRRVSYQVAPEVPRGKNLPTKASGKAHRRRRTGKAKG